MPHYTKEQLERYIECTEEHIIDRYAVIYAVGNEEVLGVDVEKIP